MADRFARCLSCNAPVDDPKRPGEVEIVDFSKARNRALRLATQPYVMWLDSDDTLEGGEHLADVVREDGRGWPRHGQGLDALPL